MGNVVCIWFTPRKFTGLAHFSLTVKDVWLLHSGNYCLIPKIPVHYSDKDRFIASPHLYKTPCDVYS